MIKILCVDDNEPMRLTLKAGLGRYGFEVILASDGVDALIQYKAHAGAFSAIISDNDMPEMNGKAFVRAVRERGFKGRIVVMSGQLKVEDLRVYRKFDIAGFFAKPFKIDLLATMLLRTDSNDSVHSGPLK